MLQFHRRSFTYGASGGTYAASYEAIPLVSDTVLSVSCDRNAKRLAVYLAAFPFNQISSTWTLMATLAGKLILTGPRSKREVFIGGGCWTRYFAYAARHVEWGYVNATQQGFGGELTQILPPFALVLGGGVIQPFDYPDATTWTDGGAPFVGTINHPRIIPTPPISPGPDALIVAPNTNPHCAAAIISPIHIRGGFEKVEFVGLVGSNNNQDTCAFLAVKEVE